MKHLIIISFLAAFVFSNTIAQNKEPAGVRGSSAEYEVKNLENLNSDQLDYSAIPFRNGVVFTSTRKRSKFFGCDSDFTEGHYSDMYFSRKDAEGNYSTPKFLDGDVNGTYHDGTATFISNQTRMYFSRNNSRGVNSNGTIDLKVYEAMLYSNHWVSAGELPFNSDEFATCHPSITPNGKWLYFSSDRPGGYGGMDIYVVEKRGDDNWSQPINLGPKVNSEENELFPFISVDNTLYWSSNGFGGMGGLDVFAIPMKNAESSVRTHLNSPINSKYDDFAFSTNFEGTEGFFTSNRKGGVGKDDLYSWNYSGKKSVIANICVIDAGDKQRINDAFLEVVPLNDESGSPEGLIEKDGVTYLQMEATKIGGKEYFILVPYEEGKTEKKSNKAVAGKSCGLQLPVSPGVKYQITVDKPGYQPVKQTVSAEEILSFEEFLIPINSYAPVAMRGQVIDKNNNSPIPFAEIKVLNKCTGKQMEILARNNGDFSFPMKCSCDYEITATKGDYSKNYEVIYSKDISCDDQNSSVLLYLEKAATAFKPAPTNSPKFKTGAVIRLDKLYYDYNKHFIRPDAAVELDKIVAYMRQYPSLEIELGSHTDARGSDDYNRDLSQRRAEAAVDYIVSRGVSRNRISAKGYGESVIINRCGNNVNCIDYEHEQNRRTEITVTNFDEDNVRIEDNY